MAGIAVHVQAALAGALFAHVESHRAGQVATAGFRQAVLPGKSIGVVLGHKAHAETAAGLLIGHADEGEGTARVTGAGYLARDGGHGGGNKQHVYGTAAVELAVLDKRLERRLGPLRLIYGDDVRVAHEGERFLVRIAGDGHHDGDAARVGLEALNLHVFARKEFFQAIRIAHLVAGVWREVINAGIADKFLEEGEGVIIKRHAPEGSSVQIYMWF